MATTKTNTQYIIRVGDEFSMNWCKIHWECMSGTYKSLAVKNRSKASIFNDKESATQFARDTYRDGYWEVEKV